MFNATIKTFLLHIIAGTAISTNNLTSSVTYSHERQPSDYITEVKDIITGDNTLISYDVNKIIIDRYTIYNADTVTHLITVELIDLNDALDFTILGTFSLASGYTLTYDEDAGFIVLDTSGAPINVALTDVQLRATPVPISGTVTVLGAGDATAANQATEIASLASIDGKLPAGLTVTGGRLEVELPSGGGGLTDTELRASPVPVSVSGGATSTKQDEQTALLTTLNALVEANNALVQMMSQLIGAMNAGAPALRIIPIASVSTAVTGSVTATVASTVVSSLTNFGTGIPAKEMADDMNNMTVQLTNINNITF